MTKEKVDGRPVPNGKVRESRSATKVLTNSSHQVCETIKAQLTISKEHFDIMRNRNFPEWLMWQVMVHDGRARIVETYEAST